MMKMMNKLKLNNYDISGYTGWESTDGCFKQYRWCSVLYFLSYINFKYIIIIDRIIGASDHDKDIVDGINESDKR